MKVAANQKTVDAIVVTCPADVGYLSGFTGDDSSLVFSRMWACLVTDGRYSERADKDCADIDVHVRKASMSQAVADVLKGCRVRRVGVQAEHITLRSRNALAAALGGRQLRELDSVTAPCRETKDSWELRAIRKAVRIAQRAFLDLTAGGADALIGRSERQVAARLDYLMRCAGADSPAFDTIVAAGAHGSDPHYSPADTKIRKSQAVLLDWGAMFGGYCSDLTRVVFTGRIPPELAEIYEVVLRAQAAGLRKIAPGISLRAVDAAARKVIEQAGYGRQFVHSLGHGLGRDVHERPVLGAKVRGRLRKGMVVTVEPGIYIPGVGGVRIEDDVLVTSNGRQKLSSLPRKAAQMVLR